MSNTFEFDEILENWLGRIIAFNSEARTFTAQLFRESYVGPWESRTQTFPIADVLDYDAERIAIGRVIRQEIGYITNNRHKTRGSRLTFYMATTGEDN